MHVHASPFQKPILPATYFQLNAVHQRFATGVGGRGKMCACEGCLSAGHSGGGDARTLSWLVSHFEHFGSTGVSRVVAVLAGIEDLRAALREGD
eukprot:5017912-Pleurochrysis_carterae.AAC.1